MATQEEMSRYFWSASTNCYLLRVSTSYLFQRIKSPIFPNFHAGIIICIIFVISSLTILFVKKLSFFIFFIMAESTERELYGDLRAITCHQKSKFLLYCESSCIVITRSRKLARVIMSKSVVKNSVLPTAAISADVR